MERFRQVARSGFRRLFLDDDFKDALCFCPLHIKDFSARIGRDVSAEELRRSFQDSDSADNSIELRHNYISFCRENLLYLARDIEQAVHEINPKLRLGICLSARRFQDLSGVVCTDVISIFDTPEAPAFARLPGEHYTPIPLDMACSIGYHTYYDAILPEKYERCWEATAVGLAPYQPKSSNQMVQEGRISEALGIGPVLWAWPEEFNDCLHVWPGLLTGRSWPGAVIKKRNGREYPGIPVFLKAGLAHELSLEEHLKDGVIKGYQSLCLMGLPMRLSSELDSEDDSVCLFGPQPKSILELTPRWFKEGRTLVVDLPAVRKICRFQPDLFNFSIKEPDRRPQSQVSLLNETIDTTIAGFPLGSLAIMEGNGFKPITRVFDASGQDLGACIVEASVGNGKALILPFDLSLVNFHLSNKFYRDILIRKLATLHSGKLPYLVGDAFLQLLLFKENGAENFLTINYSDYPVNAIICRGVSSDQSILINLGPFDVVRSRS